MTDEYKVALTVTDQIILNSYKILCEGLSRYLGKSYEIVLHSLGNLDHSAIRVLNGFHTGRTEGAPITNLALTMLKEIRKSGNENLNRVYFSQNSHGDPMRSTTIPIHGEKGNIIGLLCINFYLNTPLQDILQTLNQIDTEGNTTAGEKQAGEIFVNTSSELITKTIPDIRREVLNDDSIPASNKNMEIIHRLYENGFFNFKNSIAQCAQALNISKNTVYLHLKKYRE